MLRNNLYCKLLNGEIMNKNKKGYPIKRVHRTKIAMYISANDKITYFKSPLSTFNMLSYERKRSEK